jgi:hypothetical protein
MVATAAMAGTGIGGVFNLGKTNTVDATTSLSGSSSGAQLGVTNSGAGPALSLKVASGKPPLSVNSSAKVRNLNASMLDGFTSGQFVQGGGQVRGFYLTLTPDAEQELLAIPGFGQLKADCEGGEANVIYVNGSHTVDAWNATIDNLGAVAQENQVSPTGLDFPVGVKGADTDGQARFLLHYTTTSGFFVIQHVATVDVAAHETGGTSCTFVASTVAGATGRFAP